MGGVEKRGIYYGGPSARLHFHEVPPGLVADVRLGVELGQASRQMPR